MEGSSCSVHCRESTFCFSCSCCCCSSFEGSFSAFATNYGSSASSSGSSANSEPLAAWWFRSSLLHFWSQTRFSCSPILKKSLQLLQVALRSCLAESCLSTTCLSLSADSSSRTSHNEWFNPCKIINHIHLPGILLAMTKLVYDLEMSDWLCPTFNTICKDIQ